MRPQYERLHRSPLRRWSWRLGSIAGIPIRVHVTLALLLVWIAASYTISGLGPTASLVGVLLVAVVFVLITVHELAHALVARRFGVKTREILLLPIGGIAAIERIPQRPTQELAIALAGPAVNVVVAALLWIALAATPGGVDPRAAPTLGHAFAAQLMWINIVLAGFNLIPAYPMDGGRVLRALLAIKLGRDRATAIAARLGQMFAIVFAVVGLFYNPWLVLIALVIWFGARHEAELVRLRSALAGVPASAAMNRHVFTVRPDEPLEDAAELLVETGQRQLPIVDPEGTTVGVLTQADIAAGLSRGVETPIVAAAPHHNAIPVEPGEPLDRVVERLELAPDSIAVVVDHGVPIGLITPEQLASFVALRTAPREPSAVVP